MSEGRVSGEEGQEEEEEEEKEEENFPEREMMKHRDEADEAEM